MQNKCVGLNNDVGCAAVKAAVGFEAYVLHIHIMFYTFHYAPHFLRTSRCAIRFTSISAQRRAGGDSNC